MAQDERGQTPASILDGAAGDHVLGRSTEALFSQPGQGSVPDIGADDRATIGRIVNLLATSRSILFITGAGLSADSGLPTYRDDEGLYRSEAIEEGLPVERALSGDILHDHPELAWKYLARMEEACRYARCNRAHEVIAEMERHFERVWVLTQNVDGLHRLAGSRKVIDIHGDLHRLRCTKCLYHQTVADYSELALPPPCPQCPGLLRPEVVLFGEPLDLEQMTILFAELDEGFDLVFSVGTSSVFPYVAQPIHAALALGRPTIEINPGVSEISAEVDIKLAMRAAPALDAIWRTYQQRFMVSAARP
jgi:NAD-dependent deacetylase